MHSRTKRRLQDYLRGLLVGGDLNMWTLGISWITITKSRRRTSITIYHKGILIIQIKIATMLLETIVNLWTTLVSALKIIKHFLTATISSFWRWKTTHSMENGRAEVPLQAKKLRFNSLLSGNNQACICWTKTKTSTKRVRWQSAFQIRSSKTID